MHVSILDLARGKNVATGRKKKKKNTVLGLDLGTTSVKAVEMTREGDRLSVTGCFREEVEDPAAYDDTIRLVIDEGEFSTKNVVVGFSGRSTLLQTLTLPADPPDGMEEAVYAEAEKYVPYDMDEAQFDYHVLPGDPLDQTVRVLLAAVRLSDVEDRLETLFSAGIRPRKIDLELVALANAAETANGRGFFLPENQPVGLIDFGASKTLITVTDGSAHVFREFPVGGVALTEMVAQRYGCGMDRAEEIKRSPGEEVETVKDAVYPGLEDIASEIRSCLDQFKGQSGGREAKHLLLSGGLVSFGGVAQLVGRLTRTEARVFGSFGAVDADDLDGDFVAENAHGMAVAFGLACHARE
jgi:type IV pilus assembly protein PilM